MNAASAEGSPLASKPKPGRSNGKAVPYPLALFGAIAVLLTVLAWLAVERQVESRTSASVAHQTSEIQRDAAVISVTVDRVFNRVQGVAGVLAAVSDVSTALSSFGRGAAPSALPYDQRKAGWEQRADLRALSELLTAAASDIGVDLIWVLNAAGDCVAASNSGESLSFVGTSYGDRSYFTSARAGKRGRQYAVGRVTKIPGLFFSAPVVVNGQFMGAVAVKNDLSRIAAALNHPDAFVTDDQGVIIFAADHSLEMRALPGAAVHQLPAEQRRSRYMRLDFQTHDAGVASETAVALRAGTPRPPRIAARAELPQHGVTVHIVTPVTGLESLRTDAFVAVLLLSFSGILVTALVFGARAYVLRVRRHRSSVESANELLNGLNRQLEALAARDGLTGLANRRAFDDMLEQEWARALRERQPLSLLMADIDHFKGYNDSNGHPAGDECLRQVAKGIAGSMRRASDHAARYGGEEFAVILPHTDAAAAAVAAEKLRAGIAQLALPHATSGVAAFVTISVGVATLIPARTSQASDLLAAADRALYEAKESGRNRVVAVAPDKDARSEDNPKPAIEAVAV